MSEQSTYHYAPLTPAEHAEFKAWCAQFGERPSVVLRRWILETMRIAPNSLNKDYVDGLAIGLVLGAAKELTGAKGEKK